MRQGDYLTTPIAFWNGAPGRTRTSDHLSNMQIQLVHDHFDAGQLASVISEMKSMGAPTIKAACLGGDRYAALEGCHRIRAAIELGLKPVIEEVEYSDASVMDILPDQYYDDITVSSVVDSSHTSPTAFFDDNPRIEG